MPHFKSRLITGRVYATISVPVIDDLGGDSFSDVEAYIEWAYATKPILNGAYVHAEIRYTTYTRVNGLWTVASDMNFKKQLSAATEKLQKQTVEQAHSSMKERNLREGRIPPPEVIPDFLDRARSI